MAEPRSILAAMLMEEPSRMPTKAPADVLPTEGRGGGRWWVISTWALWVGGVLVLALGTLLGFVIGVLA